MKDTRVIIATNSVFMYVIMKKLLEEENIKVLKYVKSGYEALKSYMELKPDLILIDIELEDMSGIDLIKLIRDHDPSARIIALSDKKDIDLVVKAIKAGAKHFISFPASKIDILAKIHEVLSESV